MKTLTPVATCLLSIKHQSNALRLCCCAIALIVAAALAPVPTWAQPTPQSSPTPQAKPNIANEVEAAEKKSSVEKENSPTGGEPANRMPAQGGGGRRRNNGSAPPRPLAMPTAVRLYEVVFTTDLPGAEIFLNRGSAVARSLGKTDAEGKLTARLGRGRHEVTASRAGARIERQQINVQPDNTSFTFNLALPNPPPKEDAEEIDDAPAPTPDEPKKEELPSADLAEEVLKRFLNPNETENVVADDWLLVQAQATAALETEPDSTPLKAQSFLAQGQLAYLRGDYAGALVAFNKALLLRPEYLPARYALGNAYLATNQPEEAFQSYKRASEMAKDPALMFKGMGDALTKQGRVREAATYYGRVKTTGGQSLPTDARLVAARALMKRKRWSQALKELEELAKTQPSADVYTDIGDSYLGLEQPLSASRAYHKATELDPKAARAHFKYGEVMFSLREYATALEAFESALALDTTGASINRSKARERANESAKKLGLKRN